MFESQCLFVQIVNTNLKTSLLLDLRLPAVNQITKAVALKEIKTNSRKIQINTIFNQKTSPR